MKKLLVFLVALSLLFFVAIGLVAARVAHAGGHFVFGTLFEAKASRVENHPLDIAAGKLLSVDLQRGAIRVRGSAGAAPSLTATIMAYGATKESAEEGLGHVRLEIESTTEGLRIHVVDERRETSLLGGWTSTASGEADLEIRLPDGVRLDLSSRSGDVDAEGAFGTARGYSGYGSVRIAGAEGDVDATSNSGDVKIEHARAGNLVAKSGYGSVGIESSGAKTVEAHSNSGDVKLDDVQAERTKAGSGYGAVVLEKVTGEIEAKSSSGDVTLKAWRGSHAKVSTGYGSVDVEGASGEVSASSSSGAIDVEGIEGPLDARSKYGSVRIDGVLSSLTADTHSGDVTVHARAGSRIEGEWRISSSYGAAMLEIPAGLGCDLDAETAYGSVEVEPQIERARDARKPSSKAVRGRIHGGGGPVEIRCTSGDVRVSSGGS